MKSFSPSPELLTGIGLVTAGLMAVANGNHDLLSQILAPFGGGLILSDTVGRAARAARERVKIRVRRDDE